MTRTPLLVVAAVLAACSPRGKAADAIHDSGASSSSISDAINYNAHILIDQFGYRPSDPKVAVIRTPRVGFDVADRFDPGNTYQVRRLSDGEVVYAGAITAWKDGAVDPTSGDAAWWFDFSSVKTPGSYFVYDAARNARSAVFTIDQLVYRNILKAAMRMYFYQRAGIAKSKPFAQECWVDDAAYIGSNQDTQAHDVTDPGNPAKVRDLSGGWFDAGDTNKYVTNAVTVVHQLLTTYQEYPTAFTDDFNIPESGNGIPDIVDEVKWEVDWLQKMQYPNGSVALKVGDTVYRDASPPSSDKSPRFYVPGCTSSTITAAGMFAHASYVYRGIPKLAAEAAVLQADAIKAWNNYQGAAAKQTKCDSGEVKVPGSDLSEQVQDAQSVVSAIYLYALTGNSSYHDYVKKNYTKLRPYNDIGWIRYSAEQGEALLFYTTLPSADRTLKQAILSKKLGDALAGNGVYGESPDDPYRNSFADYYWGSNQMRADYGTANLQVKRYGIAVPDGTAYTTRALDTLHYFHGVNPFAKVYLSNMYQYGATNSVNELFGGWFVSGSKWSDAKTSQCGPAPGFVTGGPNAGAADNGVPASEVPPAGQPPQKSYKDWNGKNASWTVSEPDDVYQAAYVQLIAAFAN